MMDAFYSASESSLHHPHTPPYTPYTNKGKRRLERADSPASSIHPAETISPKKKAARRAAAEAADHLNVQELREGDVGYLTDLDVIYPQELEEADSSATSDDNDGDAELSSADEEEDEIAIARRLQRMGCHDADGEAHFEQGRRLRRMSKRMGSRVFKRSHSQSLNGDDAQTMDSDAMDDQDVPASQRRLRRRTRGPAGLGKPLGDVLLRGSVEPEAGYQSVGTQGSGRSFHSALMTPEREMTDAKSARVEDVDESEEDSDESMDDAK